MLVEIYNNIITSNLNSTKFLQIYKNIINLNMNNLKLLYKRFVNSKEKILELYRIELNSNLTKIDTILNNQTSENNALTKIIKNYNNQNITYIELEDNCMFIQHIMNAYKKHTEGKLDDFIKTNIVGPVFLSTSLISNENNEFLESTKKVGSDFTKTASNENEVCLLFDEIYPSTLLTFTDGDAGLDALNNRFEITSFHSSPLNLETSNNTINQTIKKGKKYNEYAISWENSKGQKIKPAAIRVLGESPSNAEIKAASTLNIPLIKIKPAKIKQQQNSNITAETYVTPEIKTILNKLKECLEPIINKTNQTIIINNEDDYFLNFELEDEYLMLDDTTIPKKR